MDSPTTPLGPRRGWLPKLALVLGGLLAGFLVAELAVRWLPIGPRIQAVQRESYQLSPNPVLQYELRPGSQQGPIEVNALGMRDSETTFAKTTGVFRIACVGNSICFGYGVGPGECYADRLETLLNEHFARPDRRFEVLNFGVTGYNVRQITESVRARSLAFDPDLVVYGYCLNDPQGYSFELEQLQAQLTHAQRDYVQKLREGGRGLLHRSRLLRLLDYARQARSAAGKRRTPAAPEPDWASLQKGDWVDYFGRLHSSAGGWEQVLDGLNDLAEISREEGLPVAVAVFPLWRDLERHPLAPVHARVTETARRRGLRAIDLAPLFVRVETAAPGQATFDELHPNALGHDLAALWLLRDLAAAGWLPIRIEELATLEEASNPLGERARWIRSVWTPPPDSDAAP